MKIFKDRTTRWLIIGGLIALALAIGLTFGSAQITILVAPTTDLITYYANAQLAVTAVSFIIIIVALCFTILQVRRATAKPQLEVIFSDSGNSETIIDIPRNSESKHYSKLSVTNKGNAITKLFQIDFAVPTIFNPRLEPAIGLVLDIAYLGKSSNPKLKTDNTSMISYYSNEQVYCYLNARALIHMLVIDTRPNVYDSYPTEFKTKYSVYGDWAETQEGELTVKCNKK